MTRRLDRAGDGRRHARPASAGVGSGSALGSASATPRRDARRSSSGMPRGLNENYARELMELHTLGVAGGYTQAGRRRSRAKPSPAGRSAARARAAASPSRSAATSKGPKTVLGTTIDAGGERDGEAVLDLLAAHPSTATFIATKLARRFVADEPPPALVDARRRDVPHARAATCARSCARS